MSVIRTCRNTKFACSKHFQVLLSSIILGIFLVSCGAPPEPELGLAPVFCQPGQGVMENGEGCEACPPGTFNDEAGPVKCQVCPAGTYQDEEGSTECKPCPPTLNDVDIQDGEPTPTPQPIPVACLSGNITSGGADSPAQPPVVTENPNSNDDENDEPDPEPTATPIPIPLSGFWYHESSAGQLNCTNGNKTVDPIIGNVEVEMSEDRSQMTIYGIQDYPELVLNRIDETTYRAVITVNEGTVTVTVTIISPTMMVGEIHSVFPTCEFFRTFQLDKAG